LLYGSGYLGYANPYYAGGAGGFGGVYDYLQPIPVDYAATSVGADQSQSPADAMLTDAISAFRQGDYNAALDIVNKAIVQYPSDSVLHEFRALVLFAKGDYQQAAATLHSVLAVGPGWDWTTMSNLYANIQVYTDQLRALEAFVRNNPQDGGSRFVLAYQYLTAGHADAARRQLEQVVQLVPNDRVASELLKMLTPREQAPASPGSPAAGTGPAVTPQPPEENAQPESTGPPIDPGTILGTWQASREDGSKFNLKIGDDSTFTWKFTPPKGKANEFSGKYTVEGNVLALQREDGGSMVGTVTPDGAGKFNFKALGAPADDPGLNFAK
jgi:tetratricopeptide (TPR) repeat protein